MFTAEIDTQLVHRLKQFSRWSAIFVAAGGVVVLTGWLLGSESLKRVAVGASAVNPITALGFVSAGISLLCFCTVKPHPLLNPLYGRVFATVLCVIGLLKLGQFVFGWQLDFDQWLFHHQLQAGARNQMAPSTALGLLLAGGALWFLNSPNRQFSRWTQSLSLALGTISLISVIGYLYRASDLYALGSKFPMALPTAIFFCVLAHGILLAQPDLGVMALMSSKSPGGSIARRLFPVALAVPLLLGALRMWGEKGGLFSADLGVATMVVGAFAIMAALIWWNAKLLNRADAQRREAEQHLRKTHDELEARVQERTAALNGVNVTLMSRITALQQAESTIRSQGDLLNKIQDAILMLDNQRRIIFWNKGAERMYGWSSAQMIGVGDHVLFDADNHTPKAHELIHESETWNGELRQITAQGETLTVDSRWTVVKDDQGRPKGILILNTDITEKKNMAVQFLRSQRMDSLGSLAGGIAHDLNNALAPIVMSAQLLEYQKDEKERAKLLEMIRNSTQRCTQMVKQILSFARGSKGQAGPVQLRHLIGELNGIIRDTFPKSISFHMEQAKDLRPVQGDVTELHQVLLNLCVNARDAMPNGGQLRLTVENIVLAEPTPCVNGQVLPGTYVRLAVSDTGTGIPPEVMPRIFEPFFTTKQPDKGTGLGLSTVASIVKHHRGFIQIHTERDKGTTFVIFLPAAASSRVDEQERKQVVLPRGNGELVLVIDDEDSVRELAKSTLENYGYRVISAANGQQGVACFEQNQREIAVLLTDTDMPRMDGLTAISSIQKLKPDVQVIIASGTKHEMDRLQNINTTYLTNLGKPYTLEALLQGVAGAVAKSKG